MKRILFFFFLISFLHSSVKSQEYDTLFIYRSSGVVERISVSSIDSMTFVAPVPPPPAPLPVPVDTFTHPTAVDLGLSVMWASCNIGASSALDVGSLYAWAEVEEKDVYTLENYKWYDDSTKYYNKYCDDVHEYYPNGQDFSGAPFCDDKRKLEPEDDAAAVNWGGKWRMPTVSDLNELLEKCTIENYYRKEGDTLPYALKITGPNGNYILIPVMEPVADPEWIEKGGRPYCFWIGTGYFFRSGNQVKGVLAYLKADYDRWWDSSAIVLRWRGVPVRPVLDMSDEEE